MNISIPDVFPMPFLDGHMEPMFSSCSIPALPVSTMSPEAALEKKVPERKLSKMELSPVTPSLYFQEELLLEAARQGLKVSEKYTKPKKRYKDSSPLTFANCSWFYEKKLKAKEKRPFKLMRQKLIPSRRLLLAAHQASILRMRKVTEMYEVEYIADFRMIRNERFYLIKWVGWPEEANTWEASRNLSCFILIKEFHVDFKLQLTKFFAKNGISWNELLQGQNGIYKTTCSQRLFDAIPKTFKYRSTYGERKSEFRNQLKKWKDNINDSSRGFPFVVVENEVDMELPPKDFTYISQNIAGKGVTIPDDPIIGCECVPVCDPMSGTCSCTMTGYWRQKRLYENDLVKVKPGRPIHECNSRCKCGSHCPNRVVQKGSQYTLAIFRTPNGKGWGVKALQQIPRGAFVIEYIGEIITNAEAEQRGLEYDSEGITYLFDLDFHETETPMTVDATRFGNVSHFINHSCAPNLQVYNVFIDNMDYSQPRIALFARRNILVNEELTFDYQMTGATGGDTLDEISDELSDPSDDLSNGLDEANDDRQSEVSDTSRASSILKKKCLCNARNCRGWLVM